MKTIVRESDGLVLFCAEEFDLQIGQVVVDALPTEPYNSETQNIYWDFNKKEFYAK